MRKSWAALHDTGRFHIDAISIDWFKDLRRQMPELERQSKMSGDQYSEWLRANKLQHNVTNMFRFMEWTDKKGKMLLRLQSNSSVSIAPCGYSSRNAPRNNFHSSDRHANILGPRALLFPTTPSAFSTP
jgi:hypothetical protein